MKELDNESTSSISDEDDLFMQEVIGGDSELFFLNAYLQDILQKG